MFYEYRMMLNNKLKSELICICNDLGITNYQNKTKESIINKINENTPKKEKPLLALDLFCGCGGMSSGLLSAGIDIFAGIDIWDKAISSYSKNFEHLAVCADLTKLTPEQFNSEYNTENKTIDIIVGAPMSGIQHRGKKR